MLCRLLGSRMLGYMHPGRSPAPYPSEEGLEHYGTQGPYSNGSGSVLLGRLLFPPTELRRPLSGRTGHSLDLAGARVPRERGSAGLQEGCDASPLAAGIGFVGSGNKRIRTTFPSFPRALSPLPSPARPGRRKPGLHLPARRVRPAPGLVQTPAALLSASGHAPQPLRSRSLPPSFPVGPRADLGPPSLVSPSPPFPSPRSVLLTLGLGP